MLVALTPGNRFGLSLEELIQAAWGPGSNGIDLSGNNGGGLNYSTKQGVGWSKNLAGQWVTGFSLQSSGGWKNNQWTWISDPETGGWKPSDGDYSYQFLTKEN